MAYDIALPEENSASLQDYLDALRRRGSTALKIAAAVLVAGLLAIFFWPNTYRSVATILIEDPEIPPGLVPSTVTTFAARQIQQINQRVMTRTNMAQIIEKFDLYADERKYLPTLLLVQDVQEDVKIDVIDAQLPDPQSGLARMSTIAFTVGFEHDDPNVARQVANELVSLYLAENVRSRTEQTAETSQFMQAEVDRLDGEVRELETQMAQLKKDNEGSLPELAAFNLQVMQRSDADLLEIDRQLKGIEESKIMLDAQLAQIEPMAPLIMPDGKGVAPPADQLRALESQLAILEGRYSADHPDVVRVRRDIEALRAEVGGDVAPQDLGAQLRQLEGQLAQARERYSEDHPEVLQLQRQVDSTKAAQAKAAGAPVRSKRETQEPNNPAYIQVQAQRNSLTAQEIALRQQRGTVQAKLAEFERNMSQMSEVERQLSALQRRLATSTASYQAARDRLFTAKMGQAMETQSKGERFTLVEPPDLPLQPSSPNRPVLLALLIILVLATGFGFPQIAESLDGSINSARGIERVQGSPPLAEIPLIQNSLDRTHKRNVRLSLLVIAPVVLAILAVLVHFFLVNLDVLWYVALRRLGM
ncbi:MAG: hypothetical protein IT486_07095 [Gammaproteobacteria bacterium]|nr:hypothetical protein [Gammaproteobacteria bacterium]